MPWSPGLNEALGSLTGFRNAQQAEAELAYKLAQQALANKLALDQENRLAGGLKHQQWLEEQAGKRWEMEQARTDARIQAAKLDADARERVARIRASIPMDEAASSEIEKLIQKYPETAALLRGSIFTENGTRYIDRKAYEQALENVGKMKDRASQERIASSAAATARRASYVDSLGKLGVSPTEQLRLLAIYDSGNNKALQAAMAALPATSMSGLSPTEMQAKQLEAEVDNLSKRLSALGPTANETVTGYYTKRIQDNIARINELRGLDEFGNRRKVIAPPKNPSDFSRGALGTRKPLGSGAASGPIATPEKGGPGLLERAMFGGGPLFETAPGRPEDRMLDAWAESYIDEPGMEERMRRALEAQKAAAGIR